LLVILLCADTPRHPGQSRLTSAVNRTLVEVCGLEGLRDWDVLACADGHSLGEDEVLAPIPGRTASGTVVEEGSPDTRSSLTSLDRGRSDGHGRGEDCGDGNELHGL
jgi:hypothetical protein